MSTEVISCKELAYALREQMKKEVQTMNRKPGLSVILLGDDPASHSYVKGKQKASFITLVLG
jgi:methylenetetrahydrofolate dehydrogenase (NADP+) / methenyltetrahydrofolate cyclohydrolase